MDVVTLVMAGLVMALVIALILISIKLSSPREDAVRLREDMGVVRSVIDELKRTQSSLGNFLQEIKDRVEFGARDHERLQQSMRETSQVIQTIKTAYEERKVLEDATRKSVKHLESIIAGTTTKGRAGENILREALREFPPEMIATQFQIKGRVVEFGLILPNRKTLPIDSKWPATDLLETLEKEEDEEERGKLANRIEKEVEGRIKEVAQYIDPAQTTPQAIAAIPDAAYSILRRAHAEAYRRNVILISYSMALPYLLTFLNLNLQYSRTVDVENLSQYIMNMKRNLDEMEDILENSIIRGNVQIANAATKYRELIGTIRGAISSLERSGEEQRNEEES